VQAHLAAQGEFDEYVDNMISLRRDRLTDDLLSDLIRAEDSGDRLYAVSGAVLPIGAHSGLIPPSFGTLLGQKRTDLILIFVNAMPMPAVEPADVSNAVLFLISDESRYVTGHQFKVDSGVTIN
jgi:NAD(P)-dependent dehydrogenase (short-subunit alcohol dehydrogenase family)